MTFDDTNTDALNRRVSPTFKFTLRAVADAEHRSMINKLEVLPANYYEQSTGLRVATATQMGTRGAEQLPETSSSSEPMNRYKNNHA